MPALEKEILPSETPLREVVLHGKGVHSGLNSSVRFQSRDDALPHVGGMKFIWHGWPEPLCAKDLNSLTRKSRRATVLEGRDGQTFRTPEHLLAACLFFSEKSVDVFCNAIEPPGLDGSALPFFNALMEAVGSVPEITAHPEWQEYDSDLKWEYEGPEGSIKTSPAKSFSVDYVWDKSGTNQRFTMNDPALAVGEILPARTFISYREWLTAKDSGSLLAGADADSGLLLAQSPEEFETALRNHPEFKGETFPLLHPEAFRFENEPVRHKILDLMGDLALLNLALPRLRIEVRNGGHALNHLLLEQLLHEQR